MTAYIGTATSRVDGHDKVTGAAKYAGEFTAPNLAYASVLASAIARGRIARIDSRQAMKVSGVIAVLTHENRPAMADNDKAYKDDVAPDVGSPFRPLYDDRIHFSGQPIALVLAETSETARFAASLVHVDYDEEPHVTDVYRARDDAFALEAPAKPRGNAAKAFAASDVRHDAEYYVPIEHHNPMEPYASTVLWEGDGKLTVYDKTQGVQNVQRYICGIFDLKSEDVRVMSPFVGGAFGSGLRPQYEVVLAVLAAQALQRSVRVVLTRQQMYGLGYRPAMIQRIKLGAKLDGTLDAITHDAITVTSQYEDFHRNETTWSGLLYTAPRQLMRTNWRGSILRPPAICVPRAPRPASMRSNARWMNWRSPSSSIRWSCACGAIRTAIRTAASPSAARTCANVTGGVRKRSAGTSAIPPRARCAMATN